MSHLKQHDIPIELNELCQRIGTLVYVRNIDGTPLEWCPCHITQHTKDYEHQVQCSRHAYCYRLLKHAIYRVDGSDIIYRNGHVINRPPYHPEWFKQSLQPSMISYTPTTWNDRVHPILNVLLHGTISSTSSFRKLRGQTSTLLHMIWSLYISMSCHWELDPHAYICVNPMIDYSTWRGPNPRPAGPVTFPQPKGIRINMMPFILGDRDSLPDELHEYYKVISRIHSTCYKEKGHVCYLTIDEREVSVNESHRRAGLHVESPGWIIPETSIHQKEPMILRWGAGQIQVDRMEGGIYMASNMADSCAIYPCRLMDDMVGGNHGSLEHVRQHIPCEPIICQPNMLYWITDKTPHESLPLKQSGYRQFIRVVTSHITGWYADHSTPNPLGITPPSHVTIIHGNKFSDSCDTCPPTSTSVSTSSTSTCTSTSDGV